MEAWMLLSKDEGAELAGSFRSHFAFNPGEWSSPGWNEPTPSLTYTITRGMGYTPAHGLLHRNLEAKVLAALQADTPIGAFVYALDWFHYEYAFYPHAFHDSGDPRSWRVPVFPDGDYYIFVAPDFSAGVFGHPWEHTICVFGADVVRKIERDPPVLFDKPIRRDGQRTRIQVTGWFEFADGRNGQYDVFAPMGVTDPVPFVIEMQTSGFQFGWGRGILKTEKPLIYDIAGDSSS